MSIYVSTTFDGIKETNVKDVLKKLRPLRIDGVELGSTHYYTNSFEEDVLASGFKNFFVHNYCPPSPKSLVLNIASNDELIRKTSIEHIKKCIDFSNDIKAKLYTLHPGFLSDPIRPNVSSENYDFIFSENKSKKENAYNILKNSLEDILNYADKYKNLNIAIETEGSINKADVLLMQTPEEYHHILRHYDERLKININLAHSSLASKHLGFNVGELIDATYKRIVATEISHCDLIDDQHLPLTETSFIFDLLFLLPNDTHLILEFRNATVEQLLESLDILRKRCGE